jgi:hypothetical protein
MAKSTSTPDANPTPFGGVVGRYAQEFRTAPHSPVVGQFAIGRNSYSK